ncbi:uncharacterized protein [Rutidosis leptorrhynchoides]|uniref:uncharacterized protein n=1 Tax=Rutidosis leptorrhynchoides TaxID=125765 RepID=UPI003A995535
MLVDVPLGGLQFTWRNKSGSELNLIVRSAWKIIKVDVDMDIVAKLRLLKGHLKHWIHSSRSNETIRLNEIKEKIIELDVLIDTGNASFDEINMRHSLNSEKDDIMRIINFDTVQKACVKWDVEGDENSKFFHAFLKHKRRIQQTHGVLVEGVWFDEPDAIKNKFVEFFENRFDQQHYVANFGNLVPKSRLATDDVDALDKYVDDEEIKQAVWSCGSSKALGSLVSFPKTFLGLIQF